VKQPVSIQFDLLVWEIQKNLAQEFGERQIKVKQPVSFNLYLLMLEKQKNLAQELGDREMR